MQISIVYNLINTFCTSVQVREYLCLNHIVPTTLPFVGLQWKI